MRIPSGMRVATGVALALASLAAPASAVPRPDLVVSAGSTLAASGQPRGGGPAVALACLWPFEERYRMGVVFFGDDLGRRSGRLLDPNDGTDLGATETAHRDVYGGGWRMDAIAGRPGGWDPFATATWGIYREERDQQGFPIESRSAVGLGIGAGLALPLTERHGAALTVRAHRLTGGSSTAYVTIAGEWHWHWGVAE
jgi:hypothetical protein